MCFVQNQLCRLKFQAPPILLIGSNLQCAITHAKDNCKPRSPGYFETGLFYKNTPEIVHIDASRTDNEEVTDAFKSRPGIVAKKKRPRVDPGMEHPLHRCVIGERTRIVLRAINAIGAGDGSSDDLPPQINAMTRSSSPSPDTAETRRRVARMPAPSGIG